MYLAEADTSQTRRGPREGPCGEPAIVGRPGGKWHSFPNSCISHHGAPCCDLAHEWLIAYDFAQLNGGDILSGPRWVREHSAWGPTTWPIHWCQAVDAEIVDCGVHAAIAHAIFRARGVRAFRAQFVQRYDTHSAAAWRERWDNNGASDHWINGAAIYHEGNAVVVEGNQLKLWDGSSGSWLNPRGRSGYGSVAALRVETDACQAQVTFEWGGRDIPSDEWIAL